MEIKNDNDTRKKNLYLNKEGVVFFNKVYESQKKMIFKGLKI